MIPRTVDLFALVLGVLITALGIKAMSLLPARYYFTFSQIIDSKSESQLLARPELPSAASFCRSLHDSRTRAAVDPPKEISEACEIIQAGTYEAVLIPSTAVVDGVALHSKKYKQNMRNLVQTLKSKSSLLRDGINEYGYSYERPIEYLSNEDVEAQLIQDGTANLTSLAQYAMGSDIGNAYAVSDPLRQDPEIATLMDEHETLAEQDRAETEENLSLANAEKNTQRT